MQSSLTLPLINVVTLSSFFGVSTSISFSASGESFRLYLFTIFFASSHVVESGHAGPEAIISRGSPSMSESTIEYTCAGSHIFANLPPFTIDKRFLIVFISTMSAPQERSWLVMSESSSPEICGFSNNALPPPERRKRTVSLLFKSETISRTFCVALKELSSGTGCPASKHVTFSISPLTCPYFVITIPLSILSPKYSDAAFAICHAAFPTETRITLPGNSLFSSALITALSGRTAFIAASIILSATFFNS